MAKIVIQAGFLETLPNVANICAQVGHRLSASLVSVSWPNQNPP